MKLNISKKITGLEIMTLKYEKISLQTYRTDVFLHCLQGCLRKQAGRKDV